MSIIGGLGYRKTNALPSLLHHQPDFDQIYLDTKDPYEPKCYLLINKCEQTSLKHFKNQKAFIEYLNHLSDVYPNFANYNPCKKQDIDCI